MTLSRLEVTDFRCLQSASVEFDSRFTLISGPNASGKTSLLESIYLLGRGRSFRTRRLEHVIRSNATKFVVFGEVSYGGSRVGLGVEGSDSGVRARKGGAAVQSLAELAELLPVQIIDPEVHRLIEEGPAQRRRFLDWGVFHVEHSFISTWRGYQQALRQRNAALRSRLSRASIVAWDGELIRLGELVSGARVQYVAQLLESAARISQNLLHLELGLVYRTGWKQGESFSDALVGSFARDVEVGATTVGPHRAELAIRLDGELAKDRVSRGQQKLLAAALLIAQISRFPASTESRPVLLLDDPAAELDSDRLILLIREVTEQAVQLVVTSLNSDFRALGAPGRKYSIERGQVRLA